VQADRRDATTPRVHELKCWPPFFQAIRDGEKTFEVRKNDRGFQKGDTLRLREFDPNRQPYLSGAYTGREFPMVVSYVLSGFEGIAEGYVVMGLRDA
jgi:hypothetical protein